MTGDYGCYLRSSQEPKLCQKCSVLYFDDSAHGGYVTKDDLGYYVLGVSENDPPYGKELKLDYVVSDTLPDLPYLEVSAASRCVFCRSIRTYPHCS